MFSRKQATSPRENTRKVQSEAVSSRLLPMLLASLEPRRHINVLDVSGGAQSTLNFFQDLNAKIHFVDLFSSGLLLDPPEEISAPDARRLFRDYLDVPSDVVFDVCLFWDAFHHMDLNVLQGFSLALTPHIDHRSLGYGFGALYSGAKAEEGMPVVPSEHYRYGILDESHLALQPAELTGHYFSHSQQQISEHFAALTIRRATLLRDSRLELLLTKI